MDATVCANAAARRIRSPLLTALVSCCCSYVGGNISVEVKLDGFA